MEERTKNNNIRVMVLTALMVAITFMVGGVIKIPTLNGFIQPGDCMVLLGAVLLGKKRGALSGAIGMAFVDITAGYIIWAPFTFIIKGAMAYFTGMVLDKVKEKNYKGYLIAFIIGGIINIIGYFIGNIIIGGIIIGTVSGFIPSIIYAISLVLGDTLQSIVGVIIALILAPIAYKAKVRFDLL
ncbi:MAG: ECF transporter S component [Clostridium perfringens]|nr:ECF transporter S component [Clostridium perfringens]